MASRDSTISVIHSVSFHQAHSVSADISNPQQLSRSEGYTSGRSVLNFALNTLNKNLMYSGFLRMNELTSTCRVSIKDLMYMRLKPNASPSSACQTSAHCIEANADESPWWTDRFSFLGRSFRAPLKAAAWGDSIIYLVRGMLYISKLSAGHRLSRSHMDDTLAINWIQPDHGKCSRNSCFVCKLSR